MNDLPSTGGFSERRASDRDRERAAETLNHALASGRLSLTEHDERLSALYAASTLAEVDRLTQDLPALESEGSPRARGTLGLFSKVVRGGDITVGSASRVRAVFGVAVLDLTRAAFTEREVVIDASSFCGKTVITVPANARVEDEGGAVLGKRNLYAGAPPGHDGPRIRITGRSVLGKLTVHRAEPD